MRKQRLWVHNRIWCEATRLFARKILNNKKLENKKKLDAGGKIDARGDDKLMFFLRGLSIITLLYTYLENSRISCLLGENLSKSTKWAICNTSNGLWQLEDHLYWLSIKGRYRYGNSVYGCIIAFHVKQHDFLQEKYEIKKN